MAAEEIANDDPTGTVRAFLVLASGSAFSTNVTAGKIEVFDSRGAIVDARRVKVHLAGDEAAGSLAFEGEQGQWLALREGFEALWRDGHRIVYGAVNAGGMGVERPSFGPFCLVVADPAPQADELAVFPADSAVRYCSPTGAVDRERARSEAVTWRCRGHLATIERGHEARTTAPSAWPLLICNPSRYLEAVVTPGPTLEAIDAVRVRGEYLARLEDLKAEAVDTELDPSVELHELIAFEALNRWRTAYKLDIESVG